jgi:hypothetical protein
LRTTSTQAHTTGFRDTRSDDKKAVPDTGTAQEEEWMVPRRRVSSRLRAGFEDSQPVGIKTVDGKTGSLLILLGSAKLGA